MSLKPAEAEKGIFKGCMIPVLIGVVAGGGIGYYVATRTDVGGTGSLIIGMATIVGCISGLFLGSIIGLIVNIFAVKKEKEEEGF